MNDFIIILILFIFTLSSSYNTKKRHDSSLPKKISHEYSLEFM
jgi:hypothetical protein